MPSSRHSEATLDAPFARRRILCSVALGRLPSSLTGA